jgi:hypothetical protein
MCVCVCVCVWVAGGVWRAERDETVNSGVCLPAKNVLLPKPITSALVKLSFRMSELCSFETNTFLEMDPVPSIIF